MPTPPDPGPSDAVIGIAPPADRDVVRLEIPAKPRYLAPARLVAAALGAEAGLTIDDLDDLRLGVDELLATLVEAADGAVVRVSFAAGHASIDVRGELHGPARPAEPDDMTRRIVAAVSDDYELGPSSFRLRKSASS